MSRGHVPDLAQFLSPVPLQPPGAIVFRPSLRSAAVALLSGLAYILAFGVLPLLAMQWYESGSVDLLLALAGTFGFASAFPLLIGLGAAALRIAVTRYTVDAQGIHVRTTLLQSTEQRVPWEKVTAVLQRRTIFDGLLGVERLNVVSYGTHGTTLSLVGLRNAAGLRDLVATRMRQSASVESWLRLD